MKRIFINIFLIVLLLFPLLPLQGQVPPPKKKQEETAERKLCFLPALGFNLASNAILYLALRYVAQEPWSMISIDSIKTNFSSPWQWDIDEYIINQFGHPYQGLIYHAAARANGFTFYESVLFDAFGSIGWELFFETDIPAANDLITTTLSGASLGEMLHRLYYEIPSPLAILVSPIDGINGLITGRRSARETTNIYSLNIALGMGYNYSRQATGNIRERTLTPLQTTHSASTGVSFDVVYGDPFVQQSWIPYEHFELSAYADTGYPFWYDFNIQSNGYLFSFNIADTETRAASTGLTMHYDLFSDRHINFFAQSLDWTYKYERTFNNSWNFEFKGHLGGVLFNADNSYFLGGYSSPLQKHTNYGAGVNMKLFFSTEHEKWGKLALNANVYEVFSLAKNYNKGIPDVFFLYSDISYAYPLGEQLRIGAAASFSRNAAISHLFDDTDKLTYGARIFIGWSFGGSRNG